MLSDLEKKVHANLTFAMEQDRAMKAAKVLAKARKDLIKNTPKGQVPRLDAIDNSLRGLDQKIIDALKLKGLLAKGFDMGSELVQREAPGLGLTATVSPWVLSNAESAAAQQVVGIGARLRDKLKSEIEIGLAQGLGAADLRERLFQTSLPGGPFRDAKFRAERVARTISNDLVNAGKQASYEAYSEAYPELDIKQQFVNVSDHRTSDICKSLNGQIRPVGLPFDGQGWSGMRPPCHPMCRSTIVPYLEPGKAKRTQGQPSEAPKAPKAPRAQESPLLPTKDPYDKGLARINGMGIEKAYAGVEQNADNSRVFSARKEARDWASYDGPTKEGFMDVFLTQMRDSRTHASPTDYAKRANYDFKVLWDGTPPEVQRQLASAHKDHSNPVVESLLAKARPETKPTLEGGFPADLAGAKVVRALGGSTGAELVEIDGRQYVRKLGASPDHLREEARADSLYRAAGLDVPNSRVYETPQGPVKLAEYLDGAVRLGDLRGAERDTAYNQLRKGLAVDALLGNWDVVGAAEDNVLVKDGKVYRVDNGGALRYRAQGLPKGDGFNGYPTELWSIGEAVPDLKVSPSKLVQQGAMLAKLKPAIDGIEDPGLQALLSQRLNQAQDSLTTMANLGKDGYNEEYTSRFAKAGMSFRQAEIDLPKKLDPGKPPEALNVHGVFQEFEGYQPKDEHGKRFDGLRGEAPAKRIAAWLKDQGADEALLKNYHKEQGGSSWSNTPLLFKVIQDWARPSQEGRFWAGDEAMIRRSVQSVAPKNIDKLIDSYAAYHAMTYETLRAIDLPNKTADGKARLFRTELTSVMTIADFPSAKQGETSSWARGPLESTSLFNPVVAMGGELTQYEVPLHRIFSTYLVNPYGKDVPFAMDSENEATVDLGDLPAKFLGTVGGDYDSWRPDPTMVEEGDQFGIDPYDLGAPAKPPKRKKAAQEPDLDDFFGDDDLGDLDLSELWGDI